MLIMEKINQEENIPGFSEGEKIFLDKFFEHMFIIKKLPMKRSFAIALLSGVLIMNMGMFCHSLCIGGHHEKAQGDQHLTDAHVHQMAHHKMIQEMPHKMSQKMPHEMPHGEGCPMGQDMRHKNSNSARHALPETLIRCGCTPEDNASSVYEATLLKPIIADLTPHLKTVSTVTYQHTLFSSRGPIPVEGPPKLLS